DRQRRGDVSHPRLCCCAWRRCGRCAHLRPLSRDPAELKLHVVSGLDALVRILGEAGLDQTIEARAEWYHLRGWRWLLVHDRRDETRLALAIERAPARRHLVEHAAQRPDVAAGVGLLALELLRRHVLERADDRAFGGERLRHRG